MILSYNTNGFAHHSLEQAVMVLASLGYRGVAITIDHGALCPFEHDHLTQLAAVRKQVLQHDLAVVVETGARFLLDPLRKHEPTLVSPSLEERAERIAFYRYAIDVAVELRASCVSVWSGVVHDGASRDEAFERLLPPLSETIEHAEQRGVVVALEPEPGMAVARVEDYSEVKRRLGQPATLRLTLDVGHLHCQGETPIADFVRKHADEIANVHIEDMRTGVHEHLMFGEGQIDFPPIIAALEEIGYEGPLSVELSRHSHMAPIAARKAFEFLTPFLECRKQAQQAWPSADQDSVALKARGLGRPG